ncbi:MAG: hypothetical protein H0X26_07255 [Alphaproteobacteria bacterium]|nr:hypothetical protein [Alphaproteobacteria bacterium]
MLERLSSQGVPWEVQIKLDEFFEDLKERGISYIGHGVVSDQGKHTGYFSDKQWGEIYIQRQFFFIEPILENYRKTNIGLICWNTLKDTNAIAHMRNEFTSITSGLTICKREGQFNTFFNIGFSKDIDLVEYTFFNKDILLAYLNIFNNSHILWRKYKNI